MEHCSPVLLKRSKHVWCDHTLKCPLMATATDTATLSHGWELLNAKNWSDNYQILRKIGPHISICQSIYLQSFEFNDRVTIITKLPECTCLFCYLQRYSRVVVLLFGLKFRHIIREYKNMTHPACWAQAWTIHNWLSSINTTASRPQQVFYIK